MPFLWYGARSANTQMAIVFAIISGTMIFAPMVSAKERVSDV